MSALYNQVLDSNLNDITYIFRATLVPFYFFDELYVRKLGVRTVDESDAP